MTEWTNIETNLTNSSKELAVNRLTVFILCLFQILFLGLYHQASAKGVALLSHKKDVCLLGPYFDILEDPESILSLDDVSSPEYKNRFVACDKKMPTMGYTSSSYWVKFTVKNIDDTPQKFIIEHNFANMQYIDFYASLPGGNGFKEIKTGVARLSSTRDIPFHRFIFNLSLLPSEEKTCFVHYKNDAVMNIALKAWPDGAFYRAAGTEYFIYGMYYGILLIMLGYNLFIFFSLRESVYFYYVIYLFTFICFQSGFDGFFPLHMNTDSMFWKPWFIPITFGLAMIGFLKFTAVFLSTKTINPRLNGLLVCFMVLVGLLIILLPVAGYKFVARSLVIFLIFILLIGGPAGVYTWLKGYLPARFYIVAGFWFIVGALISCFSFLDIFIPISTFTEYSYRIGSVLLILFLSLGLADRINSLKKETETANRNLKKSEQKFRAIFNQTFQFTGLLEPDGTILAINETALKFAGIQEAEAMGKKFSETLWWTHSEKAQKQIKQAVKQAAEGSFVRFETTHNDENGNMANIDFSLKPIKNNSGEVILLIPEGRDITEIKMIETALKESEEKHRILIEYAQEGIIVSHGEFLDYVNPYLADLLGYDPVHLTGKKLETIFSSEEFIDISDRLRRYIAGEIMPDVFDSRIVRNDGQHIDVEYNTSIIPFHGKKAGLIFIRDITERKKAQLILQRSKEELDELVKERTTQLTISNKMLGESEAKIRSFLENSPDYILNIDENLNILYINKGTPGHKPENIIGTTIYNYIKPEDHALFKKSVSQVFQTGKAKKIETHMVLPDGSPVWLQTRFAAIKIDGNVSETMLISTDITKRRQAQAELAKAQKVAVEKAHKAGMADIAAGTLHNVGNLLNSVMTSAQILWNISEKSQADGLKKANQLLRENLDSMEDFILNDDRGKKLLHYYLKIEELILNEHEDIKQHINRIRKKIYDIEGVMAAQEKFAKTELYAEKYVLGDIVEYVLKLQSGTLELANIKIEPDFKGAPQASIQKVKLINILVNLINNSVDAMAEVSEDKRILEIVIDTDGKTSWIKISDNGDGIPKENISRVFNHGFTTKKTGKGFGLHDSANCMAEMNGEILVESNGQGQGASFILKFPKV